MISNVFRSENGRGGEGKEDGGGGEGKGEGGGGVGKRSCLM